MKQTHHMEEKGIAEQACKLLYTTGIYIKRTGRRCKKLFVKHVQKAWALHSVCFKKHGVELLRLDFEKGTAPAAGGCKMPGGRLAMWPGCC